MPATCGCAVVTCSSRFGFDSFGIHTENFALKVGENPITLTERTIDNYRCQLSRLGAAWSWDAEVVPSNPDYYRWTPWIFVRLFKAGVAGVADRASHLVPVNA